MGLYKKDGSNNWYFEFIFQGQRIRESAGTKDKQLAMRIMDERRRKLEMGRGGVREIVRPILFSVASKEWYELKKADWHGNTYRIEKYNIDHLTPHFGKLLLLDITGDDVKRYQVKRKAEGASEKTIHLELATLRAIMRKHRLWTNIQPDVKMPSAQGEDVGRPLEPDEQHRLLVACKASRSRALYPAFVVSLHTGVRFVELSHLQWRNVDLIEHTIRVGKSKGRSGEGRVIPLSDDALDCLKKWRKNFPDAKTTHYVFCSERYGLDGENGRKSGKAVPYSIDPTKPMGQFQDSWDTARQAASVECRWHDLRHTFVSMLAENGATDTEITAVAGWMSPKMLARYSHARTDRKRAAIARAFNKKPATPKPEVSGDPTQFPPQSGNTETQRVM